MRNEEQLNHGRPARIREPEHLGHFLGAKGAFHGASFTPTVAGAANGTALIGVRLLECVTMARDETAVTGAE